MNVGQREELAKTDRAVQSQHDDHEEEDNGKESSCRHVCYGLCVNDEQETGTLGEQQGDTCEDILKVHSVFCSAVLLCFPTSIFGHSGYILLPHLSHVAQHGEDDEARQEAGQTVDRAGDQSVSVVEKQRGF